ncbi:uncharacterized protein METZ01_LOCUS110259 [marine metagenome]|uniref:Uncharacterized protein n=1 Tax=marine metagenome TaxID=408172 RepID=A0A381WY31_9ZZZZ
MIKLTKEQQVSIKEFERDEEEI